MKRMHEESPEGNLGNLVDLFKPRKKTDSVNGATRIRTCLHKVALS